MAVRHLGNPVTGSGSAPLSVGSSWAGSGHLSAAPFHSCWSGFSSADSAQFTFLVHYVPLWLFLFCSVSLHCVRSLWFTVQADRTGTKSQKWNPVKCAGGIGGGVGSLEFAKVRGSLW